MEQKKSAIKKNSHLRPGHFLCLFYYFLFYSCESCRFRIGLLQSLFVMLVSLGTRQERHVMGKLKGTNSSPSPQCSGSFWYDLDVQTCSYDLTAFWLKNWKSVFRTRAHLALKVKFTILSIENNYWHKHSTYYSQGEKYPRIIFSLLPVFIYRYLV